MDAKFTVLYVNQWYLFSILVLCVGGKLPWRNLIGVECHAMEWSVMLIIWGGL